MIEVNITSLHLWDKLPMQNSQHFLQPPQPQGRGTQRPRLRRALRPVTSLWRLKYKGGRKEKPDKHYLKQVAKVNVHDLDTLLTLMTLTDVMLSMYLWYVKIKLYFYGLSPQNL